MPLSLNRKWLRGMPILSPHLVKTIITIFIVTAFFPVDEVVGNNEEIIAPCPNMCNGHGKCKSPYGTCECLHGYIGSDCSQRVCPKGEAWWTEIDTTSMINDNDNIAVSEEEVHGLAECSNRGICNRKTGQCECQDGFQGISCERFTCPNNCSLKGRCVSLRMLAHMQDPGTTSILQDNNGIHGCLSNTICEDEECTVKDYLKCFQTHEYTMPWDSDKIYGCYCDKGYSGYDCSIRDCPTGDDVLTGALTSFNNTGGSEIQVNEVQLLECYATSGTFTLMFMGETTDPIPYNSNIVEFTKIVNKLHSLKKGSNNSTSSSITVNWLPNINKVCTEEGISNPVQITFLQNFGDLSLLLPDGSGLKLDTNSSSKVPMITSQKIIKGTKESDICSNHGICDESNGVCECFEHWMTSDGSNYPGTRGDCGYYNPIITEEYKLENVDSTTVSSCPGEPACLGFGTCSGPPDYRCQCQNSRKGPDCSLRTCPKAKSWFSFPIEDNEVHDNIAECSNMGICDTTNGKCLCNKGYTGSACEYLQCPTIDTGNKNLEEPCRGNGQCISTIDQILLASSSPLEKQEQEQISSSSSLVNYNNWDYHQIRGCLCSNGWEGYDCSLKSCPKGDDPQTLHQNNEIQYITCTTTTTTADNTNNNDSDDYFQIIFNNKEITKPIYMYSDTSYLEDALNDIGLSSSEMNVKVEHMTEDPTAICSKDSNSTQIMSIEFLRPTGDVPLLQVSKVNNNNNDAIVANIIITEEIKGTKEYVTCSGRGICDNHNGACKCFHGYGSSDGQGNVGLYGDCGYKSPVPLDHYWEHEHK